MMASGLREVSWARNSSLVLDAFGLGDGEVQLQGRFFDRRSDEFEAASFGTIGLRHDEMNAESGFDQLLERGDGEARSAAENEIEGHWVIEVRYSDLEG